MEPLLIDISALREKIEKAKTVEEMKPPLLEVLGFIFEMMMRNGLLLLQDSAKLNKLKEDSTKAKAGIVHLFTLLAMTVYKKEGTPETYEAFEKDLRYVIRSYLGLDVKTLQGKIDDNMKAKLDKMSLEELEAYVAEQFKRMN